MAQADKLRCVREAKGLSQAELGKLVRYSKSVINRIENGRQSASPDYLNVFKEALDLRDVPLTDEETERFREELHSWRGSVDAGEHNKAAELLPGLDRRSKWSHDSDLRILFKLYSAAYYRAIGNAEALEKTMTSLSGKRADFTDEHYYWYYRQTGISELKKWNYKSALAEFFKAEKISKYVPTHNEYLYYHIAYCLTDMDYAHTAIEYLERAQKKASERFNTNYSEHIRIQLACNYIKIGKAPQALASLEDSLREAKEKKDANLTIGAVYLDIAEAYQAMGDYVKAILSINESFQYYEKGSEPYIFTLYTKARILAAFGKTDDAINCLDEVLSVSDDGTLYNSIMPTALRHSLNLGSEKSLKYLTDVAIPELLRYGQHLPAIEYFEKLSAHYEETKKYKTALWYKDQALDVHKKLMRGDPTL